MLTILKVQFKIESITSTTILEGIKEEDNALSLGIPAESNPSERSSESTEQND